MLKFLVLRYDSSFDLALASAYSELHDISEGIKTRTKLRVITCEVVRDICRRRWCRQDDIRVYPYVTNDDLDRYEVARAGIDRLLQIEVQKSFINEQIVYWPILQRYRDSLESLPQNLRAQASDLNKTADRAVSDEFIKKVNNYLKNVLQKLDVSMFDAASLKAMDKCVSILADYRSGNQ